MRGTIAAALISLCTPAMANTTAAPPTTAAIATPDRAADLDRREHDLAIRTEIADTRDKIEDASHTRLEIIGAWLSAIIGLLGAIVTAIIVALAFNARNAAVAEARREVAKEKNRIVEEARRELNEAAGELDTAVASARAEVMALQGHRKDAEKISEEVKRIAASLTSGAKPSKHEVKTLERASDDIADKPVRDLTESEFRVRIGAAIARGDKANALELAITMAQLYSAGEAGAYARFQQGWLFGELGRLVEAVSAYNDLVVRFRDSKESDLNEWVAKSLLNQGLDLASLGRTDEAITVSNDIIVRFGDSEKEELRDQVDKAHFNIACYQARGGRVADAIATLRRRTEHSGSFNCEDVASDADFDTIRDDPAFVALLAEMGCPTPIPA